MSIFQLVSRWGEVAGVAGISIGVLLIIFREIVRRDIFPKLPAAQATRILTLIIIFTFGVAMISIAAYVYLSSSREDHRFAEFILMVNTASARELERPAITDAERQVKAARIAHFRNLPEQYDQFRQAMDFALSLLDRTEVASGKREFGTARQQSSEGDPGGTIDGLRDLAAKSGDDAALAHSTAAVLLEGSGRFDEAMQSYSAAAATAPGNAQYLSNLIDFALNTGRQDLARQTISAKMRPLVGEVPEKEQLARYQGLLGEIEWFSGQAQAARELFDTALAGVDDKPSLIRAEVLNHSSAAYYSYGNLERSRQQLEEAANIYACLAGKLDPRTRNVLWNLTKINTLQGRLAEARFNLRRSSASVGDQPGAASTRSGSRYSPERYVPGILSGLISEEAGQLDEAMSTWKLARDSMRNLHADQGLRFARLSRYIGAASLRLGDLEEASRSLNESYAIIIKIFGRSSAETSVVASLLAVLDARKGKQAFAEASIVASKEVFSSAQNKSQDYLLVLESAVQVALTSSNSDAGKIATKQLIQSYRDTPELSPSGFIRVIETVESSDSQKTKVNATESFEKELASLHARRISLAGVMKTSAEIC